MSDRDGDMLGDDILNREPKSSTPATQDEAYRLAHSLLQEIHRCEAAHYYNPNRALKPLAQWVVDQIALPSETEQVNALAPTTNRRGAEPSQSAIGAPSAIEQGTPRTVGSALEEMKRLACVHAATALYSSVDKNVPLIRDLLSTLRLRCGYIINGYSDAKLEAQEMLRLLTEEFSAPSSIEQGKPVAWRYRYGTAGMWKYVENADDVNPSPEYAKQALYADQRTTPPSAIREWLPIATAPKDKDVLITDGAKVSQGGWIDEHEHGMVGWWSVDGGDWEPTHWMPMPKPIDSGNDHG